MSSFSQPAVADPESKFVPKDNVGALLLFFPTELKRAIATSFGESDAIAARVVRLNDGKVMDDALVFPTALVTQLKAAIPDGMVLGTLGQGTAKNGNSAPWLLSPHTAEQVAIAEQWLASNPRIQQAAPPTPAAQAPAWGQQQPAAAPAAPATGGWGSPAPAPQAPVWGSKAGPGGTAMETDQDWGQAAAAQYPAPAAPGQGWNVQPQAAPAGPAPDVDPGLVEALRKKGVNPALLTSMDQALQIWAVKQYDPDVAV